MNRNKWFRVILVVATGAVCLAAVAAFLVFAGVFHSDKSEAADLFLQASKRLMWSSIDEYVGTKEMTDGFVLKGGSVAAEMSGIHLDADAMSDAGVLPGTEQGEDLLSASGMYTKALLNSLDLSGYTFGVSMRANNKWESRLDTVKIEKGDNKITLIRSQDEGGVYFALPDLIGGKVFHTSKEEYGKLFEEAETADEKDRESLDEEDIMALYSSLQECLGDQAKKIQEDMACEKMRKKDLHGKGDNGYLVSFSKELTDSVFSSIAAVFCEQNTEITRQIGQYLESVHPDGSVEIKLYEKADTICLLEFTFSVFGVPVKGTLTFEGEKGDSSAVLEAVCEIDEVPFSALVKITDKKGKQYENVFTAEITAEEEKFFSLEQRQTLVPDENRYQLELSAKDGQKELFGLSADGSVKDLKQGICVSYILDQVKIRFAGEKVCSASMNLRLSCEEGEIEPPQGEVVEITAETTDEEMEEYRTEMQNNLIRTLSDMKLISTEGLNLTGIAMGG